MEHRIEYFIHSGDKNIMSIDDYNILGIEKNVLNTGKPLQCQGMEEI